MVAELYDPATGTWSLTGSLPRPRGGYRAVLLPTAKALIAGGDYFFFGTNENAQIYDPTTGTFTESGSVNVERRGRLALC
jgi:hypothetical protein